MDKFIKLLLEKENTAILPGFGAIVIENENTGKLMFNEYLKFNDGKLDAIIVEHSTMELQEAQNYVAKHVREMMTQLDKGETYDIYGLGSFFKDNDGKINFEGALNVSEEPEPEQSENESVSIEQSEVQSESEDESVEQNESESEDESVEQNESENVSVEQSVEQSENQMESEEQSEEQGENQSESEEQRVDENESKEQSERESEEMVREVEKKGRKEKDKKKPKEKEKKKKKKKKGVFFWFLIILLVLMGASSVLVALNYDEVKAHMGWDEFEEIKDLALIIDEEDEEPLEDALERIAGNETEELNEEEEEQQEAIEPVEEVVEQKPAPPVEKVEKKVEKPKKTEQKSNSGSGSYHLIAGTFSNPSNAQKLVEELKSKGHPAAIIGVFNGLSYVSVQGFASSTEARDNVERIQRDAPGAWIYKQP